MFYPRGLSLVGFSFFSHSSDDSSHYFFLLLGVKPLGAVVPRRSLTARPLSDVIPLGSQPTPPLSHTDPPTQARRCLEASERSHRDSPPLFSTRSYWTTPPICSLPFPAGSVSFSLILFWRSPTSPFHLLRLLVLGFCPSSHFFFACVSRQILFVLGLSECCPALLFSLMILEPAAWDRSLAL